MSNKPLDTPPEGSYVIRQKKEKEKKKVDEIERMERMERRRKLDETEKKKRRGGSQPKQVLNETRSIPQMRPTTNTNMSDKKSLKRNSSVSGSGENGKKKGELISALNLIGKEMNVQREGSGNQGVRGFINKKPMNTSREIKITTTKSNMGEEEYFPSQMSSINQNILPVDKNTLNTSLKSTQKKNSSINQIEYNFQSKNPMMNYSLDSKNNNSYFIAKNLNEKNENLLNELTKQGLIKTKSIKRTKEQPDNVSNLRISDINMKGLLTYIDKKYYEVLNLRRDNETLYERLNKVNQKKKAENSKLSEIMTRLKKEEAERDKSSDNFYLEEIKENILGEKIFNIERSNLTMKKEQLLKNIEEIQKRYKEDIQKFKKYFSQLEEETNKGERNIKEIKRQQEENIQKNLKKAEEEKKKVSPPISTSNSKKNSKIIDKNFFDKPIETEEKILKNMEDEHFEDFSSKGNISDLLEDNEANEVISNVKERKQTSQSNKSFKSNNSSVKEKSKALGQSQYSQKQGQSAKSKSGSIPKKPKPTGYGGYSASSSKSKKSGGGYSYGNSYTKAKKK
ncbi:MAG: hypothetical protein MJ252_07010 [archaeon]|nr:hypothetical protein [archaeon]